MTIYALKWIDKSTNKQNHYACSSMIKAQKKLKELTKDPNLMVLSGDDSVILKYVVKTQDQAIDLINTFQ